MKRLLVSLIFLIIFILTSCGDDGGRTTIDLSGNWEGVSTETPTTQQIAEISNVGSTFFMDITQTGNEFFWCNCKV